MQVPISKRRNKNVACRFFMMRRVKRLLSWSVSFCFLLVFSSWSLIASASAQGSVSSVRDLQISDEARLPKMFQKLHLDPHSCVGASIAGCERAYSAMAEGVGHQLLPFKVFPNRVSAEFAGLFSSCKLVLHPLSGEAFDQGAREDPLRISINGPWLLPFGPFKIYRLPAHGKSFLTLLSATGFINGDPASWGRLKAGVIVASSPTNSCRPKLIARTEGGYDVADASTYWLGIISMNGIYFTVSMVQADPAEKSIRVTLNKIRLDRAEVEAIPGLAFVVR